MSLACYYLKERKTSILLVNTPLGLLMRSNYGLLHLHTKERSERTNVGYSWLVLLEEHHSAPSSPVLRPARLLHHMSSWGGGVFKNICFRIYFESHWKPKMFLATHSKIWSWFPKEIRSPTLLYRHKELNEITQAFRKRVRWQLELDSEPLTPACFLPLLLFCTFPSWQYCRGSCTVQGLQVPPSQTPTFRVFFTAAEFGRIKAGGNK